jgi:hypothetical protein
VHTGSDWRNKGHKIIMSQSGMTFTDWLSLCHGTSPGYEALVTRAHIIGWAKDIFLKKTRSCFQSEENKY